MVLQAEMNGAFVADGFGQSPPIARRGDASPLAGLRLAVKDIFSIEGMTCAAGNPAWAARTGRARNTAPVVRWLLESGAQWVGKTVTDELTYSLSGINLHYGTPVNPRASGRIPGGSSSGSAVAVAAGWADIALGSDCGGSVRLPASYNGLWGVRPTHGRVTGQGCFALAPSFDTIGWFARDAETLAAVSACLLNLRMVAEAPARESVVSEDMLDLLDEAVRQAFEQWLAARMPACRRLPRGTFDLAKAAQAFRVLQGAEIWRLHGQWVSDAAPVFGADVASRFEQASRIRPDEVAAAQQYRAGISAVLSDCLTDAWLLTPAVPGPAPWLDADDATVDAVRSKSFRLLCLAGLAGLPQVVFPWTTVEAAPVGLSLLGGRHTDDVLVAAARELASCPLCAD